MQLQKQIQWKKNLCVLWNNLVPAGWLSGTDWDRERLHLQAGFWSWFHVWGLSDDRSARNPWIWRSLNVNPRWSYTAEQVLHGTPSGGKPNHILQKTTKASGGPVLLGATTNFEFTSCPGIDNSVATHGGVVAYRAGVMQPLQVPQPMFVC